MATDFSSVLRVASDKWGAPPWRATEACHERFTIDGECHQRGASRPPYHVGIANAKVNTSGWSRYLFPLWSLAMFARLVWGHGQVSDLFALVFVVGFVTLFVVFIVAMSNAPWKGTVPFVFRPPAASKVEGIIAKAVPSPAVRTTGRVDVGLAEGDTIVEEYWGEYANDIVRFLRARSFVVIPDEGAPVVVELEACPLMLGEYEQGDPVVVPSIGKMKPLGQLVVRQGDRVEITAATATPTTHHVLESGATLYRETAMTVTSRLSAPVVIRVLSA